MQEINMLVDENAVVDPKELKEGDIVSYKYYLQTGILRTNERWKETNKE